jgi:hypothetical protein
MMSRQLQRHIPASQTKRLLRSLALKRIVITEDKGFGQLVKASDPGSGVILLRFHANARTALADMVVKVVTEKGDDLQKAFTPTYGPGSAGRPSVAIAVRLMNVMIPAFHSLIRNYGSHVEWDPIPYPRLGSAQHLP